MDARFYEPLVQALQCRFGDRLRVIVLFGSRARGQAREDSDHDLFVVIDELPKEPVSRSREIRMALLEFPERVNFYAKTSAEFECGFPNIMLDICTDGICLFGSDYFDPFQEKGRQAIRQSGMRRRIAGADIVWSFPQIPKFEWELTWEGYRELTRQH